MARAGCTDPFRKLWHSGTEVLIACGNALVRGAHMSQQQHTVNQMSRLVNLRNDERARELSICCHEGAQELRLRNWV